MQLIRRFDSLSAVAAPFPALELRIMIATLGLGAPVVDATITLNGHPAHYSVVAEYEVDAVAGVPGDSTFTMYAWRGANADTIVLFQYFPRGIVAVSLSTPSSAHEVAFGTGTGSVVALTRGDVCTMFPDALGPADTIIPPAVGCRIETISTSVTAALRGGGAAPQSLTFAQPLSAIRVEFDEGS